MADGDAITFIRPGEEHWAHSILGADGEALSDEDAHALNGFDTAQKFADNFFTTRDADWRAPIAGDDTKFLSTLQRFENPEALGTSFREAQQTIRAGNIQKPLGEDPTDEDVAAWRTANNIPLEVEGYLKNMPEGLVLGDNDKEIFNAYLERVHGKNASPEIVHETLAWYNEFVEMEQDAEAVLDDTHSTETNDALRAEWGSDYRPNINAIEGLIASTFGKDAAEQLLNGRYKDGRAFMNDPDVLKGLATIARKIDPLMQIGDGNTDNVTTMNDEIAKLEKYMRDERTAYNADQPAQDRLLELYDIRIEHERKTAA